MPPPATQPPAPSRAPLFGAACWLLLGVLAVAQAWNPLDADSDFWAHAAVGRWILAHRALPPHMLFLWTDRSPWVLHEWLSQVVFSTLLTRGESTGAYLALAWTAALALAAAALLLALWRRRAGDTVLLPIFGSMALWLAGTRFVPRPEMWSLLFLATLLVLLDRAWQPPPVMPNLEGRPPKSRRRRLPLQCALIAGLFALWANLHGLVFVGLAFLFSGAFAHALQELAAGWRARRPAAATTAAPRPFLVPLAWCAAGALGTLANPQGVGLWSVLGFAHSPRLQGDYQITEFIGPFTHPMPPLEYRVCLLLLLGVSVMALACAPCRRLLPWVWLALATALVLWQRRHCALFAFTALWALASTGFSGSRLWDLWRGYRARTGAPPLPARPGRALLGLARGVGLGAGLLWLNLSHPARIGAAPLAALPLRMCTFLQRHKLPPQWLADYEDSSYLLWRFGPQHPLYIHELNVSEELSQRYQSMLNQDLGAQNELDNGPINVVILRVPDPVTHPDWPLLAVRLAYDRAHWAIVYAGGDGVVWVRRTPSTRGLCASSERRLPPALFLPRFLDGHPQDAMQQLPLGIISAAPNGSSGS